jgi:hypothetical protein
VKQKGPLGISPSGNRPGRDKGKEEEPMNDEGGAASRAFGLEEGEGEAFIVSSPWPPSRPRARRRAGATRSSRCSGRRVRRSRSTCTIARTRLSGSSKGS